MALETTVHEGQGEGPVPQGLAAALQAIAGGAWTRLREPAAVAAAALDLAVALGGFGRGVALLDDRGAVAVCRAAGVDAATLAALADAPAALASALDAGGGASGVLARCLGDRPAALAAGGPAGPRVLLLLGHPGPRTASGGFEAWGPALAARLGDALERAGLAGQLVARTRELERVVAELTLAQRRGELARWAGAVAHELRNPLGLVAMHLELLRERGGADAETAQTYDLLIRKLGEANATVQQFLELSRPPLVALKGVALGPLLESFAGFLAPQCRLQNVALAWSADAGLPPARADETLTQRCLLDLCLNALQMLGPAGGRLELRAQACGGGLALAVSDNGPGIPESVLPRLFEPFATGRSGGTGLGLYNVRRLCREMGGSVLAGTLATGGTRFRIFLPAADAGASFKGLEP